VSNEVRLDFAQYLWTLQKQSVSRLLFIADETELLEHVKECALRAKVLKMLSDFAQSCPICKGVGDGCDFCGGVPLRFVRYEMVLEPVEEPPSNVIPFRLQRAARSVLEPVTTEQPVDA
jgi:hypothetical protein